MRTQRLPAQRHVARRFIRAVAVTAALMSGTAWATPNFAREYDKNCAMCHTVAPQLNKAGYEFRLAGYRFPDEIGQEDKTDFNLGNRMAARLEGTYAYAKAKDAASGETESTSELAFEEASLFPLAGSWGANYGSFAELSMAPGEPIEIEMAFVRAVYGDADGWFQTRLGVMHAWEGFGASDESIGISSPLFRSAEAAGSPFVLDELNEMAWEVGYYSVNTGTSVSARIGNGGTWTEEGFEAAQGGELSKQAELPAADSKSYAVVVNQFIAPESAVMVRYYRTQIPTPNPFDTANACGAGVDAGTPGPGCTKDSITRLTAYANYFAIPNVLNILAGYGWGNDDIDDPSVDPGLADVGKSRGYFGQVDYYPAAHRFGTGIRYDSFDPSTKAGGDRQNQYALFCNFMVYKGLQVLGEAKRIDVKSSAGTSYENQLQVLFRLTQ